jgi:serine/threonine protein phosphatase PrpC
MKTTEEIYLNAEEITNLQQTVSDMLGKLIDKTKKNGTEENYTQLVVQLNPDINHGKEWKMFVYYNQDNDTFTYSYQDQNCWDSDFYPSNTREFMLAKVLEEAKAVGGVQWIALDF